MGVDVEEMQTACDDVPVTVMAGVQG